MDQRTRYAVCSPAPKRPSAAATAWPASSTSRSAKLEAWLKGEEDAPLEAFLGSLDVIADGPFAGEARPIRVAVIREKR